jgi:hypothetical protein
VKFRKFISEEYLNEAGNLDQKKLDMVARLGGNWYSRSNENNLFEVPKPLVTKGIGFDLCRMPSNTAKYLQEMILGMLANTEVLPEENSTLMKTFILMLRSCFLKAKLKKHGTYLS